MVNGGRIRKKKRMNKACVLTWVTTKKGACKSDRMSGKCDVLFSGKCRGKE